jgi:FkbM family methyltransferase
MGSVDNDRLELKALIKIINEYDLPIKTFLEVGSRNGSDADFVCKKLNLKPENVFIVEAHPGFYKYISSKFTDYNVFNYGAWSENGELDFHASLDFEDGRSSLIDRDIYKENFKSVTVSTRTIDHMIENDFKSSIDCCKIDVEGASYEVLQGFVRNLQNVKALQIETEQKVIWNNQHCYDDVYNLLESTKFKKVWELKLGKTQIDSIWIKK